MRVFWQQLGSVEYRLDANKLRLKGCLAMECSKAFARLLLAIVLLTAADALRLDATIAEYFHTIRLDR
jgi:hypothetical protein